MIKIAVGMILGILIGGACRWFDIPVPSPPKLVRALLVVAMTVDYLATDKLIATRFIARRPATTKELCGEPAVCAHSADESPFIAQIRRG